MPVQNQRRQYPTQPASVALARTQVREFLEGWEIKEKDSEEAQNAILVVSELTTNAVLHGNAGGQFSVLVALDGDALTISVRDSGQAAPLKRAPQEGETNGRGLFLVDMIARDWGWRTEVVGKTVWAELPIKVPSCAA
ncbi:ATP-binding protein [Streptomyces sp. SID13726]|uniref:ATP-binding protein n=1 Tax=Streptomyces sp. SID13726 TaxID=2706058 RepID=UPI0013BE0A9A|nr:ATP-binding protein [Streptomyces sp. SID13726]NEB04498.1 ATP-binding protein [Streptomyces sp. SID13726]